MISTSDLQALIEKADGGTKGVDLVKIGVDHYNGEVEFCSKQKIIIFIEK